MASCVPMVEDYLALDGSNSTSILLNTLDVAMRLPTESDLLTGTPLIEGITPAETAATKAPLANDLQMARDQQDDEQGPRRSSRRSSLGTAT